MDNDEKIIQMLEQIQSEVHSLKLDMNEVILDLKFLRVKQNEHDQSFVEVMRKIDKSNNNENTPDPDAIESKINDLIDNLNIIDQVTEQNTYAIEKLKLKLK